MVQEQGIRCLAGQDVVGRVLAGAILDAGTLFRLQQGWLLALGQGGIEVDGFAEEVPVLEAVAAGRFIMRTSQAT